MEVVRRHLMVEEAEEISHRPMEAVVAISRRPVVVEMASVQRTRYSQRQMHGESGC